MKLHEFLRQLRLEAGLTQSELANRFQLRFPSSVANFENGRKTPRATTLRRYAELFNLSLGQLMLVRAGKLTEIDGVMVETIKVVTYASQQDDRQYIVVTCANPDCCRQFMTLLKLKRYCCLSCRQHCRMQRQRTRPAKPQ